MSDGARVEAILEIQYYGQVMLSVMATFDGYHPKTLVGLEFCFYVLCNKS